MIDLIVIGEGLTEETFVRDVLAGRLAERNIFLEPRIIPTSARKRGGALSRTRVLVYLRNTLRQRADTYVTTLFDLYGLTPDFPGKAESSQIADPLARANAIEKLFADAVIEVAQCRAERFIPHIQPYEFESLLFTDIGVLTEIEPGWQIQADQLEAARSGAASPEHINDGQDTHPSARLQRMLTPRYQKVLHGSAAAGRIGLERIRAECKHFGDWLGRIEALQPLRTEA